MEQYINVLIGIQARSTSTRFPSKVMEPIGGKALLQHVIDACNNSAHYLNRWGQKRGWRCTTMLLTPEGDPITEAFRGSILIHEGSEQDVLSRYAAAAKEIKADYIVRVTGDCPLIPSYLISKHVTVAVMNQYDYTSNVDEKCRTSVDGHDCEVISKRLLDYMLDASESMAEREHVTLIARERPPKWAQVGHVVGYLDLSHLKLSVDTPEDLERVRAYHDKVQLACKRAEEQSGKRSIHRF